MYYTVEEIATKLRLHEETIRRLIRTKKLEAFKTGKKWLISQEQLDKYLRG